MRLVFRGAVLAILAVAASLGGSAAAALLAQESSILHVTRTAVVTGRGSGTYLSQYWLDEGRQLARVVEETPAGLATHASGPNWLLDVPALEGPALRYETREIGSLPTKSVSTRLYLFRDALRSGKATIVRQDDSVAVLLMPDGRQGALRKDNGLPIWEVFQGTRIDYAHEVQQLAPHSLPEAFFSDAAGRRVITTAETDLSGLAARTSFGVLTPGSSAAGVPFNIALHSRGNPQVPEQIHQIYGTDGRIQFTMSVLPERPTNLRPGAQTVPTSMGEALLYSTSDGAQLLLFVGNLAIVVHAPDSETALTVLSQARLMR